jgi:Uncharacterised protein family UPF0547
MSGEPEPRGDDRTSASLGEDHAVAGRQIDDPSTGSDQPGGLTRETKTCPLCAETVKSAALLCRYCGHVFDGDGADVEARLSLTAAPGLARQGVYRRPHRRLLAAAVCLVIGLPMSIGAFLALQSGGPVGYVSELGLPAINAVFSAIGVGTISTSSSGSRGSIWLVLALIGGAVLVVAGLFLLVWVIGSTIAAFSPRAQAKKLAAAAQPVAASAARQGAQGVSLVAERGRHAGPQLAEAASKGKRRLAGDVLPLVSASAARGRAQWRKTAPRLGASAMRGRNRLRAVMSDRAVAPTVVERSSAQVELPAPAPQAELTESHTADDATDPA